MAPWKAPAVIPGSAGLAGAAGSGGGSNPGSAGSAGATGGGMPPPPQQVQPPIGAGHPQPLVMEPLSVVKEKLAD